MSDLQCPARLFVARHGRASYAVPDVMTDGGGWLTGHGREQARDLADRLRPERIAGVYTSHLERAIQTGAEVATALRVTSHVLAGVQELASGDLEGVSLAAVERTGCFQRWLDGDLTARWPGGESGAELVARMGAALGEVADQHRGEAVVVISHGGVMSVALPHLVSNPGPFRSAPPPLPNCAVVSLEGDADGWRLVAPWPGRPHPG